MNEIICPNCKKAFKVDKAGFADILKQVRDSQFEQELSNRLTLAETEKESAVKLAEATVKNSLQEGRSGIVYDKDRETFGFRSCLTGMVEPVSLKKELHRLRPRRK